MTGLLSVRLRFNTDVDTGLQKGKWRKPRVSVCLCLESDGEERAVTSGQEESRPEGARMVQGRLACVWAWGMVCALWIGGEYM